MTELCRLLEWDTAFFGFRIARVETDALVLSQVDRIDQWCCENRIQCLYFLARADDANTTRLAENNDYRLVDMRLTFERELRVDSQEAVQTRLAQPADLPILKTIAHTNYHDTRFYYDANFPRHLCDAFYETWLIRSCEGYADAVLVIGAVGEPLGYLSCHISQSDGIGKIGLVGVNQAAQGQGIGQTLVRESLAWFSKNGLQTVTVATQTRNVAAQRLYQRCGFVTASVNLWYHKWFT